MKIKVGTRQSELAMTQTKLVVEKMKERFPEHDFQIICFKTMGDKLLNIKLDTVGGKGLFIKELEEALLNNEIDFAVHSAKDMPAVLHHEFGTVAVLEREDPRDVLISNDKIKLSDLKKGAIIGTSSARREAQIKELRPDIICKTIRGNVNTRINKLKDGEYDAIVLAAAGINRLGFQEQITEYFGIEEMTPAVCQGILLAEFRKDSPIEMVLEAISRKNENIVLKAERAFMSALEGDCSTALGAYAEIKEEKIVIKGMYEKDGKIYRANFAESIENPEQAGKKLAEDIISRC